MNVLTIGTKSLTGNRIKVTSIKNALMRKELPKSYYAHVPYMYWADPSVNPQYLIVNYIGGIDDIAVGSIFSEDKWERLCEHMQFCENKLHTIRHTPMRNDLVCPFCGDDNFDKIGLKHHLNVHCEEYRLTDDLE